MIVQHNITAMNSNRMLGLTTSAQAKSSEKLSSGYKINRAADDAAGLTISEKMRRQIRGLTQASLNAQDGISCVQTAEGALTEVHDMLQRMDELATKAANGTMTTADRQAIQDEIDQLIKEIDRVSETTNFNEMALLKGDPDPTKMSYTYSYKTTDAGIAVADGVDLVKADGSAVTADDLKDVKTIEEAVTKGFKTKPTYAVSGDVDLSTKTGTVATDPDLQDIVEADGTTGVKYKTGKMLYDANGDEISVEKLNEYIQNAAGTLVFNASLTDTVYTTRTEVSQAATAADFQTVAASTAKLYDEDGNEIAANKLADYFKEGKLNADKKVYEDNTHTAGQELTDVDIEKYIDIDKKAAALEFRLHVGAESEDANKISVTIESMSAAGIGIDVLEDEGVMTQDDATNAIDTIKKAISQVSTQRSALGAVQNRLEHTINNLDNIVENTTAAEAQIRDTDIATEMVRYANNNILQQAGTSMLSQANQTNQLALSLLG